MIPRESSKSEAVSTKAICTTMHQNEMGKKRAERKLGKGGRKEKEKKKGENVSDSVRVRKEISTQWKSARKDDGKE